MIASTAVGLALCCCVQHQVFVARPDVRVSTGQQGWFDQQTTAGTWLEGYVAMSGQLQQSHTKHTSVSHIPGWQLSCE